MRRSKIITIIVFSILLGLEIYWLRNNIVSAFKNQINWVSLGAILEIILLIALWFAFPSFKKIFGEGKLKKRRRLHLIVISLSIMIFLLPFVLLYINGLQIQPDQIPPVAQLSVIGISIGLAGITLTASRISNITPEKRLELICVSQKFITATVLFIFFVAAINMIDNALNGIDVNSFSTTNLSNITNWYRGILFYLSVPSFYVGLILFLVGLVDLVFAFLDLDTRPTVPR